MSFFGPPDIKKFKAKNSFKRLTKALTYTKDPAIRKEAAQALGQIGDSRAVDSLFAVIKTDEVPIVCEAAIEALVKIGTSAVEPIITAVEDGDPTVRKAAAKALGQIGDSRAIKPLINTIKDDDKTLCIAAVEALGYLGDVRSIEPLIAALQIKDASVCEAVVKALDRIGWKPKGDAEEAANRINKGEFNKMSELNYQAIEEILIMSLYWSHRKLDWKIRGQVALMLVRHNMSRTDPRLQPTIQELQYWAIKPDKKGRWLEGGERNDHIVEEIVERYERERALASAYLRGMRLCK